LILLFQNLYSNGEDYDGDGGGEEEEGNNNDELDLHILDDYYRK
jgi:hypothetical protein